jgi:hypothetical protein
MKAPLPQRRHVPEALLQRHFWINYRLEETDDDDGHLAKVPCSPSGYNISAHERSHWTSFGKALSQAKRSGQLGVGFVLSKADPFVGLDFDDCREGTMGFHPAAWQWISQFAGTYQEWTVSGNGARVLVLGTKNGGRCKNEHAPWGGKFEMYDQGRFFAFTGDLVDGAPLDIRPFPSVLPEIEAGLLGNGSEPVSGLGTGPVHEASVPRHDALRDAAASMMVKGVPEEAALAGVEAAGRAMGLDKDRGERVFMAEVKAAVESARKFDTEEQKAIRRERDRRHAKRVVDAEEASLTLPTLPTLSFREELAEPEHPEAYAIDELALEDGNVLIPALRKSGKTTLMFNLVRSLVDGHNFLDRFEVRQVEGSVVVLSYEMPRKTSKRWLNKIGVENQDQVRFWHLKGEPILRFWQPDVQRHVADWLKSVACEVLMIDSAGAASRGLVKNHNDRAQVDAFTAAVDELKKAAGVRESYVVIHMGWAAQTAEDDTAHTLGSEAWEAWPEFIWPFEKDRGDVNTRIMRPFGRRDVDEGDLEPFVVHFNKRTWLLTAGLERSEHREGVGVRAVCEAAVRLPEWCTSTDLRDEIVGVEKDDRSKLILAAEDRGLIERRPEGRSKLCRLTEAGRSLVGASNVRRVGD